jgi:hypothetical protein
MQLRFPVAAKYVKKINGRPLFSSKLKLELQTGATALKDYRV